MDSNTSHKAESSETTNGSQIDGSQAANERIIVFNSAKNELTEFKKKPEDFEKNFIATGAPGRGRYVRLYYNLKVGDAEPVKLYFTTCDLFQLGWSMRRDRWFRNNVTKIWIPRSGLGEDTEVTGCFEEDEKNTQERGKHG
ncbi:hypothetical protein MMC10_001982 [Thelotrema lepadinum]|nr:hypothetical protein [Thelotrema lepadinum]